MMDVATRVRRSNRENHERTVPRDTTYNNRSRHGQFLMVKTEEDFHNKSLDFQEDTPYQRERACDNIETFLRARYWSKEMIQEYCSTGGLIVLMQLIINCFTQFCNTPLDLLHNLGGNVDLHNQPWLIFVRSC